MFEVMGCDNEWDYLEHVEEHADATMRCFFSVTNAVYMGYKKVHGIQVETVLLSNGLMALKQWD